MNKFNKEFIGHVVAECSKKGVSVEFIPKNLIGEDGCKCSGLFDEDGKRILVATRKAQKDWIPILVHEFSHFQQWAEKDPVFTRVSNDLKLNGDMWNWLDGEKISKSRVKKSLRAYQKLELDCEIRSVENIKNFNLPINVDEYIKMANAYILFYEVIVKTRNWYSEPPYRNGKVLETVPNKFINSFKLPDGFEEYCMDECF